MRRSSSSSAEEVDAEGDFSWGVEAMLVVDLEAVFALETAFSLEVPTGVWALVEDVELVAFMAVEGFRGTVVEVSAMVCER